MKYAALVVLYVILGLIAAIVGGLFLGFVGMLLISFLEVF